MRSETSSPPFATAGHRTSTRPRTRRGAYPFLHWPHLVSPDLLVCRSAVEGGTVAELPSGTVTFLFTDIERSTRLWQEHSDAMRVALARHDEVVRDSIESHAGYVVKT